jgi:integrase
MRYEWATSNPIRLVRQSAARQQEEIVLAPVEVAALLGELRDSFRALILLASVTGLRRGELFGLKWEDVDFDEEEIRVVRSLVDQVEGPPKTLASRRPIPMSSELASAMENWRKQTSYASSQDWVFASPQALGKKPYWPDAVLKRHILPAAEGRYYEADRLAQLPPDVGHAVAILWGIGKDDAGASAALFASDDPWKICKGTDRRQAAGSGHYLCIVRRKQRGHEPSGKLMLLFLELFLDSMNFIAN